MNPRVRNFIIIAGAIVFAIVCAADIADANYTRSALACAAIVALIAARWLPPKGDAILLAITIAGYVIGNRGFAQLQLIPRLPLLPAEGVLVIAVPAVLYRMAFRLAHPIRRDALNLFIALWVLLGAARLPMDFREFRFVALRDFAMVYYAVFFFLAQAFEDHAPTRAMLHRALTITFVALPAVVIAYHAVPDLIINHVTVRGVPLIFQKSDQIATFLMAGFFWLWTRHQLSGRWWWAAPAGFSLALIAIEASPRAAMVAGATVTAGWLLHRRWRIAAAQAAFITVGILVAFGSMLVTHRDVRQTALYSAYEHAISVIDFSGHRRYIHQDSGDPGDNNQFRLVWWRAVASETMQENPVFGLGFGADLAERFIVDYDLIAGEEFTTRSPHSIIMSIFGRMGFSGLILWLAMAAAMLVVAHRALSGGDWDAIGLASVAWVIWFSACFGVVLESPMAAVVFWTALGLANARLGAKSKASEAAESASADATGLSAEAPATRCVAPTPLTHPE